MNQLKEVLEELEELVEQHEQGGELCFRYAELSRKLLLSKLIDWVACKITR